MNILIVAKYDWSGAGYALMQAINKHTPHKARAISFRRTKFQYPYDILKPSARKLKNWISWANVLNIHDDATKLIPSGAPKRPIVKTYHGTRYRNRHANFNRADKRNGYLQTCLTIDLSLYGPKWVGRAMPDLSHMHDPCSGFCVVHLPSGAKRKGTKLVSGVLSGVPGIELIIATNLTNAECLRRKARGYVLVDQFGPRSQGYGTGALEAWSMGMPVVSRAPSVTLEAMRKQIGYVPFIQAKDGTVLRKVIERLRDDKDYYDRWRDIGVRYVREHHDPTVVAAKFTTLCSRVTPVAKGKSKRTMRLRKKRRG